MRSIHRYVSIISILLVFSTACLANPLKDRLKNEFKNRSYVIKGFPEDTKLEVNSGFQPANKWHEGSWTTANILVEDVKTNDRDIEFLGHRVGFLYDAKKNKMIKVKLGDAIDLKIKGVAGMNPDDLVRNIRKQVLLSEVSDIEDVLPESWKPYFRGDFKPSADGKIHFHPPGLAPVAMKDEDVRTLEAAEKMADGEMLYKVSQVNQVDPPKPVHTPDPQYSEIAKKTETEGVVVLWAIVDRNGNINSLVVERPMGLGLDEEAMAAVQQWKFEPARHNGQPVAVQINVEVNFRLYR